MSLQSVTSSQSPVTRSLEPTQSTSDQPSDKLKRVRKEILQTQTFAAKLPEQIKKRVVTLIDDYAGPDPLQEEQLSEDLAEAVCQFMAGKRPGEEPFYRSFALHMKCNGLATEMEKEQRSEPLSEEERRVNALLWDKFFEWLKVQIRILPFAKSSPIEVSLNVEQTAILITKSIECAWQFFDQFSSLIPHEKRDKWEVFRSSLVSIGQEGRLLPLRALFNKYGQNRTLSKSDRSSLNVWVRDVISTQRKYASLLPPVVYSEGDSEGFGFVIKKGESERGFVQGTYHYLDKIVGGYRVSQISKTVQQRLYECAILGTEVAWDESNLVFQKAIISTQVGIPSSVDAFLLAKAYYRGIVNFPLDHAKRDVLIAEKSSFGVEFLPEGIQVPPDEVTKLKFDAYVQGDFFLTKLLAINHERHCPETIRRRDVFSQRNASMAKNMDELLKACEEVGREREESPAKCFFAVGVDHLIGGEMQKVSKFGFDTIQKLPISVIQLLSEKGWVIEYLPPSKRA